MHLPYLPEATAKKNHKQMIQRLLSFNSFAPVLLLYSLVVTKAWFIESLQHAFF